MEFNRKARFVSWCYLKDPLQAVNFSNIMSRDTVIIMLTIEELNNLDVKLFNIFNKYPNTETYEKV